MSKAKSDSRLSEARVQAAYSETERRTVQSSCELHSKRSSISNAKLLVNRLNLSKKKLVNELNANKKKLANNSNAKKSEAKCRIEQEEELYQANLKRKLLTGRNRATATGTRT